MYPQNITVRLKFSVQDIYIYANCGAIAVIASTTYMTIMEFFDECPIPFSPEMMMIVIDHATNIYILNDIILSMETERCIKACC